jgi:hypothetical protein
VTDAALEVLSRSAPQLACLKLAGCVRTTDVGVAQLCRLPGLLTLHLDKCLKVGCV